MKNEDELLRALIKTAPKGNLKARYKWPPKNILAEYALIEKKESSQPRMIRDYIMRRIGAALMFMKREATQ